MTPRPAISSGDAERIARERYAIDGTASPLPSDRDQNFLIRTEGGERFVLKLANALEDEAFLRMQDDLFAHLSSSRASSTPSGPADGGSPGARAASLPPESGGHADPAGSGDVHFPTVVADGAGATLGHVLDGQGVGYAVRLVRWVAGVPVADVRPHRPRLLESWGRAMGVTARTLAGFDHPAARRALDWDLAGAATLIADRLDAVEGGGRRELLTAMAERFGARIAPVAESLPRQVVHGDGNDHNVLANAVTDVPAGGRYGDRSVVGVIDFGDVHHGWRAAEAGVAGAYAMLGKVDPVGALATFAAGFHDALPLDEVEIHALLPLAGMRLCLSAVMSAFQRAREPDIDYLSISEASVWEALEGLRDTRIELAVYRIRAACGLEPCPGAGALREALKERAARGGFGPVVDVDFGSEPWSVFDLSVGSLEIGAGDGELEADGWTRRLFGRMEAEGARLGIGRYDEPRRWYASRAYATERDDRPEWRTIHLGIDLFAAPETPVRAPCPGTIHSLRDNASPLDYGPTVILEHEGEGGSGPWYTLYGHLSRASLHGRSPGDRLEAGDEVGRIGPYPENGGWAPHLHFQVVADLLGMEGDFPGVGFASQRDVWLSLSPDPNVILGVPGLEPASAGRTRDELLTSRLRRLGPSLSLSYRTPLKIVRGQGVELLDDEGRAYVDCVNNVAHVGHCHPKVVEAGQRQMAVLNTNTRYLHDELVTYAERLAATFPDPLGVCFFVCSGSEANELAIRLARTHTGRRDLVVVEGGYHGNTSTLVDASSYKFAGAGGSGPPEWVSCVTMPDPYRGRYRSDDPGCGERYAGEVARALDAVEASGRSVAAFLSESVLSCGGQIVLPDGYLRHVYEDVRRAGGVCIADEVQVGFGRVGAGFWAFETQGVVPDIVTMGKPIGNGHPLAAVVTTPEIAASFDNGMEYFNTFGGNPVSATVGNAVLDVIETEGLQEHARRVGARLKAGLTALADRHALVGDARGLGLFQGIELVLDRTTLEPAPAHASYLVDRMCEKGFLLSTDGPLHNVVKLKPPMVFDVEHVDGLIAALDEVLGEDALRLAR